MINDVDDSHHIGFPSLSGNLLQGRGCRRLREEDAHQVPHLFLLSSNALQQGGVLMDFQHQVIKYSYGWPPRPHYVTRFQNDLCEK